MPTIRGILQVAPSRTQAARRGLQAARLKRGIPTVSAEEYSENNGFIGIFIMVYHHGILNDFFNIGI